MNFDTSFALLPVRSRRRPFPPWNVETTRLGADSVAWCIVFPLAFVHILICFRPNDNSQHSHGQMVTYSDTLRSKEKSANPNAQENEWGKNLHFFPSKSRSCSMQMNWASMRLCIFALHLSIKIHLPKRIFFISVQKILSLADCLRRCHSSKQWCC